MVNYGVELHFRRNVWLLLPPRFELKGRFRLLSALNSWDWRKLIKITWASLVQLAFTRQERFLEHSSISEKWNAFNHDSRLRQQRCSAFCSLAFKWDQGFSFSAVVGQKCQARLIALSKQTNKHTQTEILLSHNESITI